MVTISPIKDGVHIWSSSPDGGTGLYHVSVAVAGFADRIIRRDYHDKYGARCMEATKRKHANTTVVHEILTVLLAVARYTQNCHEHAPSTSPRTKPDYNFKKQRKRLQSIVMSMSVCLSICPRGYLRYPEPQERFLPLFVNVVHGRGAVLLSSCDTLCTSVLRMTKCFFLQQAV